MYYNFVTIISCFMVVHIRQILWHFGLGRFGNVVKMDGMVWVKIVMKYVVNVIQIKKR